MELITGGGNQMLDILLFVIFGVILFAAARSLLGVFIQVIINLFSAAMSMAGLTIVFGFLLLLLNELMH
jgi:hypothetical protein